MKARLLAIVTIAAVAVKARLLAIVTITAVAVMAASIVWYVEAGESGLGLFHVRAWATVGTGLIALAALGGAYFSIQDGKKKQRIESGPYIRVDIAPTDVTKADFQPPVLSYFNDEDVMDMAPTHARWQKVAISAWFTNFQTRPLGFALFVVARFAFEFELPHAANDSPVNFVRMRDVNVAYLQEGRAIRVGLLKIPIDWAVTVRLAALSYYDLYDVRHEHRFTGKGTNAGHGRLICTYTSGQFTSGQFTSVPTAWPRGDKVEFE